MKIPLIVSLLLLSSIGLLLQVEDGAAARILSIAFLASKSHRITYDVLLRELARRGHEVTVLSPIKSKDEKNLRNIMTIDEEDSFNSGPSILVAPPPSLIPSAFLNPYIWLDGMIADLCEKGYALPAVQQVLKEKWDLIYVTPFFNECLWGLVYKLNTTFVVHQQVSVMPWTAEGVGAPSPPSFVPIVFGSYSDKMSFSERFGNFAGIAFNWLILQLYFYPRMESIYRKALNDPDIPPISEIVRNTSLILSTNHVSYGKPRPLMPDIIEIGGIHLSPAKPVVPKELDDFLSGAKDGFIYFSMGTFVNGSTMPESHRNIFLRVFSKLKQRVLWKWETDLEGAPPNVRISKWLPQPDILGHKNIRLFLTHGGLGGTTEAIYHGVPLVGMPVLGDQPQNLAKAAKAGYAAPYIKFQDLTEEALLHAINTILNDPSYHANAKKLSSIFRDQLDTPLERAVYWVEYVLRHKGALHLRSAARDLNLIQYFSLDVIAAILAILLITLKINLLILRWIWRKFIWRSRQESFEKKKKTN